MPRIVPVCFVTLLVASIAVAQEDAPATDAKKPAPPVIADEPKTIDPATLMPAPLAAKATVVFQGESLLEFAGWFAERHGVTVLFDKGALDEMAIPLGEPVFDKLNDEPLYLLLNRLKMLELAWYYEDGVVVITSQEEAEARLTTAPYNLGDLLDAGYDRDQLAAVIISTVASDTWVENGGGEAEIQWLGDVLFLSQTQDIQRQVAGLLQALRKHGRQTFAFEPTQHLALRQALDKPISIDLDQTPLIVAIEKLAAAAGIPIRLDTASAPELGISKREPVSLRLENRSLKTVLRAALRRLELTYTLEDGVLWITTEDAAVLMLKTAVYDVRDLCRDAAEGDALTDAIISQVASSTWAENGGGESEVRFAKEGAMVVSQTEEQHQHLLVLLERYREALRKSKRRQEPGPDPDEVLIRYYRMPQPMAADLRRQLPDLVAEGDWATKTQPKAVGTIQAVNSADKVKSYGAGQRRVVPQTVLIIRQTRAVHLSIEALVQRVRTGDPQIGGGGFGASGSGGGGGFGGGFFSVEDSR
ncbi:MAG: hypothetical protein AAF589_06315 [Planctomycetota bacterium]